MKANLRIERIGGEYASLPPAFLTYARGIARHSAGNPLAGYRRYPERVAEITSVDANGRLASTEISGKTDYLHATGSGKRGVYVNFILDSRRVYSITEPLASGRSRRYFAKVTDDGSVVEIDRNEVIEWLRHRSE